MTCFAQIIFWINCLWLSGCIHLEGKIFGEQNIWRAKYLEGKIFGGQNIWGHLKAGKQLCMERPLCKAALHKQLWI